MFSWICICIVKLRCALFSFGMDYDFDEDPPADMFALQQVYQKFLMGTEVCEKLEVNNYEQLKSLAYVAQTHPMGLQQLREVQNGPYLSRSLEMVFNVREEIFL